MSAAAVGLVLGSAFLHAFWNVRTHSGGDRRATLAIAYLTGAVLLLPWLIADPPFEAVGLLSLSAIAHGGYIWMLSGAYDRGALATTYPIARGSAPLIVAVAGVWVLDQTPSLFTAVGVVVVGAGLVVIGGVALGTGQRTALAMALATGMFIAAYTVVDSKGAAGTSGLGFFAVSSAMAAALVIIGGRMDVTRLRASARAGMTVGVMSSSAYGLVLLAYTRADTANVAALRGTSILFGLALVPRSLTRRLMVGALLVVAGAILVAG